VIEAIVATSAAGSKPAGCWPGWSADQSIALAQATERHTNARQQAERNRALKTAGVVTRPTPSGWS
jgi:hypothetical protein